MDALLGDDTKEFTNANQECQENKRLPWGKIVAVITAVICLCLTIAGVFGAVKRLQILHPQGINNVVITVKDSIRIGKGDAEMIVFREIGKPAIICQLPEGFVSNAEVSGLYTDEAGNFIMFNADYADCIVNPLFGTDNYSYFEDRGYQSYLDMTRQAMYLDLSEINIFSSDERIHLAGGAKIIRQHFCAGQNADYYRIDGGLTVNGDKMRICGFALRFENTTWQITLKDYEDNYYFITIKDPNGVGKSVESVGELLASVYAGDAAQHSNNMDTVALQVARAAYMEYVAERITDGGVLYEHYVFQADNSRFVAFSNGAAADVHYSLEDALKAMSFDPDADKLFATDVDGLWAYGDDLQ